MGINYSLFLDYFERRSITEDNSATKQTETVKIETVDAQTETEKTETVDAQTETVKIETVDAQTETEKIETVDAQTETVKIETVGEHTPVSSSTASSLEASSTEEFECKCDVCDSDYAREADCFCKQCGQYLCKTCSKIHTKISSTKNHNILGKTEFSALKKANEESGLFKMKLAPLKRIHDRSWYNKDLEIHGIHQLPGLGKTCVLLSNDDCIEVGYLHSTKGYSKIQSIEISKIPRHDLDGLCGDLIYFTIPGKKRVFIYDVDDEIVEKTFLIGNECYSLTRFDNGLAALIRIKFARWKIKLLSYEGILKEEVSIDKNGQYLFSYPQQLASNHSETVLYVSDTSYMAVIALDTGGNVLFKIKDDMFKSAHGLTCDADGNIYVACGDKIVQIEKNGQKCKKLQTTEGGTSVICYNNKSKKMLISDDDKVTIYQCTQ